MPDPFETGRAEILRLHVFIDSWFRGEVMPDRFDPEFADALHPSFENIQPSGAVLTGPDLLDPIRAAHGDNPDFRIAIEEPRLLATWPGQILMGYVEVQTGARRSAPSNRRRSTVLFDVAPEGERPIWRHLHETGLPG